MPNNKQPHFEVAFLGGRRVLDLTCVHGYSLEGEHILVDGNSGSVHLVDENALEVVFALKNGCLFDASSLQKRLPHIPKEEVAEIREELSLLFEKGLFGGGDTVVAPLHRPVIKALCLNVAHDCNLSCRYCFAETGGYQGERELMPLSVAKDAVMFLLQNGGKKLEVDFFGGEPLLNFSVVKETVRFGKEKAQAQGKEIQFTLTTNGVLLNEEVQDFLNEHMYNVVLSLDGRKEVNDPMRKTVKGSHSVYDLVVPIFQQFIEKRAGRSYYVRGTFTAENLDFFRDVLHLRDLGYQQISVEPVVSKDGPYALKEEHLPEIFSSYEALARAYLCQETPFHFFHFHVELKKGPCLYKRLAGCGAGFEYLAVDPKGDLYPCHQFVGDLSYRLGNVREGVLNTQLPSLFQESHVLNKESCLVCWAKYYCSGGCHSNNIQYGGDIKTPYALGCALEKKRLECSFMLYAKGKV